MRNLVCLCIIAVTFLFASCDSGGMSATAKKNMEVNDSITKAYERGDFSKMGDYIAADAVDHASEKGVDVKGLDSIVADMKRYHAMMPDMKSTVIRTLADDEYVFTWSKMSGTMDGKTITMTGIDIAKFKDGKATEHWLFMDPKEMAAMMQSMPQPAMPAPGDTIPK